MSKNVRTEINFSVAAVQLQLRRYPVYDGEKLRAWDAADEYVLNHICENRLAKPDTRILILNDHFGALTLAAASLPHSSILSISDSVISQRAIAANAELNGLDQSSVEISSSAEFSAKMAETGADHRYDLVLIRVPKSLAQLEDGLRRIRSAVSPGTSVIAAAMAKNIHSSTLDLFDTEIGPTKTSLAKKKARLVFSSASAETQALQPLPPTNYKIESAISKTPKDLYLASYPGVFSHGKLDLGTRFMLESMAIPEAATDILDLGCGNGALGIAAAMRAPKARLCFVDESYTAIESSKESIALSLSPQRAAETRVMATQGLDGIDDQSQDLILNNPPFHDAGAQTPSIALQMFRDSKRALRKGGNLLVVGNLHLGYHKRLKEIFGNSGLLAANDKFVILKAVKF